MFVEICVAIIAFSLLLLVVVLIRLSAQALQCMHRAQIDLNRVTTEVSHLSSSLDEFVKSDLHKVAKETGSLIEKLTDLTSDINNKSHSLNFLFKPFSFLTSKMSPDSSESDTSSLNGETISQILKWITTGVFLIKTTREVVKKL